MSACGPNCRMSDQARLLVIVLPAARRLASAPARFGNRLAKRPIIIAMPLGTETGAVGAGNLIAAGGLGPKA